MNNKRKILIGSRKSNLAKEQTKLALRKFKSFGIENFSVKYIISRGDKVNFKDFKARRRQGIIYKRN